MAAGDVGEVALAAKHHRLDHLRIDYDAPIGFMLASPIPHGESYDELRGFGWIVEDKYDGIRAQAHVHEGRVRIFSRRFNDVTAAYPEISTALATIGSDVILDGEIIAWRDGRVLPFRMLQARLQRKSVEETLLREVPLAYVAFDVLAAADDFLIDEPLLARRERLAALIVPNEHLLLAPFEILPGVEGSAINERFEASRTRGNEGLMLKRSDSAYIPGRRGMWWRKLKRELSTLDVVVIAVEWGNGKRANVLSDYTFAVRGDDRTLQAIGKAYSGLTDAEIGELTEWFLAHRAGATRELARRGEIAVEPKIVLEVAFDVVARSDLHESGFSLRFPRIVRIRDDKPPEEIDTLDRVREIYREMLAREGLG
jgi:DNA ligase 1